MKWDAPPEYLPPKPGDQREFFAWLPVRVGNQTVWLEWVTYEWQQWEELLDYGGSMPDAGWRPAQPQEQDDGSLRG